MSVAVGRGSRTALRDWVVLTKPGIAVWNAAVTAAATGLVGREATAAQMVTLSAGVFFLASAAGAANMAAEWRLDAQMPRTAGRPVAAGRIGTVQAAFLAAVLSLAGTALLASTGSAAALLLGWTAVVLYVGVYTPLKRHTGWSLLPGALVGAIPPWIAAAALGSAAAAWWLGAWMALWQVVHTVGIGVARERDYRAAGLRVVPVSGGLRVATWLAGGAAVLLVPASGAVLWASGAPVLAALATVATGLWGVRVLRLRPLDARAAGRLFGESLWVLLGFVALCVAAAL